MSTCTGLTTGRSHAADRETGEGARDRHARGRSAAHRDCGSLIALQHSARLFAVRVLLEHQAQSLDRGVALADGALHAREVEACLEALIDFDPALGNAV